VKNFVFPVLQGSRVAVIGTLPAKEKNQIWAITAGQLLAEDCSPMNVELIHAHFVGACSDFQVR
jgi:hypothetical protein